MKNWYSIQALASDPETTEITIYDEIGFWGVNAADFSRDLKLVATPKIKVLVNSPGGSVIDALAIFNQLRASGKQVDVKVMGIAASAASYIAMAGDHIEMPANTFMWIHNPLTGTYGNAEEHRAAADDLDKFGASLTATYAHRFKAGDAKLAELLAAETLLTAAECLEYGLCDEVTPALEVHARFEVEDRKLPAAVKALFKPRAEPTPAAPVASMADCIAAAVKAAGLDDHLSVFALDASLTSEAAVKAAVEAASEISKIAALVGLPDQAPALIRARKDPAEARKVLAQAMADADAERVIDTAAPSKVVQGKSPAIDINPSALWADIKALQDKQRRSPK